MLSTDNFIRQSLELHLFFSRIMKEHSFFLQMGFLEKDSDYKLKADMFRKSFDKLLSDTISLSKGVISQQYILSGEAITPFTIKAEVASSYLTGIKIPSNLTEATIGIQDISPKITNSNLEQEVYALNEKIMDLVKELIKFKSMLLSNVLSCNLFTANYPLLIDHILREAKLYYNLITRLQNREDIYIDEKAFEQEIFWNQIMAEHSKFIRGLLDPTEDELIKTANDFGNEFDDLTNSAIYAMDRGLPLSQITTESFKTTSELKDFKQAGTEGLINCQIKSIIIPLLGDHVLREANHFLRLLEIFQKNKNRGL